MLITKDQRKRTRTPLFNCDSNVACHRHDVSSVLRDKYFKKYLD